MASPTKNGGKFPINGVMVQFPYEPYDCQMTYMSKVLEALQKGQNALLESPTGTGKTLCLLCASLAWQQDAATSFLAPSAADLLRPTGAVGSQGRSAGQRKKPTIVYLSRTHAQLQQVVRELKASAYRPRMCILGAREHLCIESNVTQLRGSAQNQRCRTLVKRRLCPYHLRVKGFLSDNPSTATEPHDIEDLVAAGKKKSVCPYYLARELQAGADLILVPYIYLLDKDKRKSLANLDLHNAVLIFDEAHNLEGSLEEHASVEIPTTLLAACQAEAKKCILLAQRQQGEMGTSEGADPQTFQVLQALLARFELELRKIPLQQSGPEGARPADASARWGRGEGERSGDFPGSYVFQLLETMNISARTVPALITTLEHAMQLLSADAQSNLGSGDAFPAADASFAFRLEALRAALRQFFSSSSPSYAKSFRTHISEWSASVRSQGGPPVRKPQRALSWWCFNPGVLMADICKAGVHSLILTSGTLSPLAALPPELNTPFEVTLENPHVISPSQICVAALTRGPRGTALNSSFKARGDINYKMDLGNALVNIARIVPGGLLVFFPSYAVLDACAEAWKAPAAGESLSISQRLKALKSVMLEPRESSELQARKKDYEDAIHENPTRGAMMLGVCRGKMSEGLDFSDAYGRAVVITGIPYAMKTNARVRLKKEYLDENFFAPPPQRSPGDTTGAPRGVQGSSREAMLAKGLTGQQWYSLEAVRAVNQAVGRVIRHRNDFGAIFLLDERFAESNLHSKLSVWLRPYLKVYQRFGDAEAALMRFFQTNSASPPRASHPSPSPSQRQPGSQTGSRFGNSPVFMGPRADLGGAGSSARGRSQPSASAAPAHWGASPAARGQFTPLAGAPKQRQATPWAASACTPPHQQGGTGPPRRAPEASSQTVPRFPSMSQAPTPAIPGGAPEARGGSCALSQLSRLRSGGGAPRGDECTQSGEPAMRAGLDSARESGAPAMRSGMDGAQESRGSGASSSALEGYTRSTPSLSAVLASLTDEGPGEGREAEADGAVRAAGAGPAVDVHAGRGLGAASRRASGTSGGGSVPNGGALEPADRGVASERGRKRAGSPTLALSAGPIAGGRARGGAGDFGMPVAGRDVHGQPPGGDRPRGSGVRREVSQYLAEVQGALSSSERAAFMRILREYQQQSLAQREAAGEAGESTGELAARVLLRPLADFLSAPSRYPLLKGFKALMQDKQNHQRILDEYLESHAGRTSHERR